MDWSLTRTVLVKGIAFTIRTMTAPMRAKLNVQLAPIQAKLLGIANEMDDIRGQIGRVPLPGQEMPDGTISAEPKQPDIVELVEQLKDAARRFDEVVLLERNPVLVRVCLESVSGLTINGKSPDPATFYEHGPASIADAVIEEIEREYGLGLQGDDAKNFESPTTSGAVEDGATQTTTA